MNRFLRDFGSDGQKLTTRAFEMIRFQLVKLAFGDLQLEQGSVEVRARQNNFRTKSAKTAKGRTRISTSDKKRATMSANTERGSKGL